MKKLNINILLIFLFIPYLSFAQVDLNIGEIGIGGNGCPAGSVYATNLFNDQNSSELTLHFDNYVAETGPINGKTLDRKSCNLAIPVSVPNGFSVSLVAIDFLGFTDLPSKTATAKFSAEYFLAGQKTGIKSITNLKGPTTRIFKTNKLIALESQVESKCNEATIFRINTNILLKNKSGKNAVVMIDHADLKSGIVFKLNYKKCQ